MNVPSPRQNRVDPWGALVADPARGAWTGNRGCLHDTQGRIRRSHQGMRWIICLLSFKGRRRTLMQPGRYTELFFLDEATALAAGHRPCAECQPARFRQFVACWAKAQGCDPAALRAPLLDAALQAARFAQGGKLTYTASLSDLPDGVIVAANGDNVPRMRWQGRLWQWGFAGYLPCPEWPDSVAVLTPRPTVAVLAAGYPVQVHHSCDVAGTPDS